MICGVNLGNEREFTHTEDLSSCFQSQLVLDLGDKGAFSS